MSTKDRIKSRKGFTLMELMIVVVIVGLAAAIAAPSFDRSLQQFRFKSATRDMLSTLRKARSYAVSEKTPYGVYFDYSTKEIISFRDDANLSDFTYDAGSDSIIAADTLAGNYSFLWASFPDYAVIFQPNGTSSNSGYIYMYSERDGSYNWSCASVLASTGRSRIVYLYNY